MEIVKCAFLCMKCFKLNEMDIKFNHESGVRGTNIFRVQRATGTGAVKCNCQWSDFLTRRVGCPNLERPLLTTPPLLHPGTFNKHMRVRTSLQFRLQSCRPAPTAERTLYRLFSQLKWPTSPVRSPCSKGRLAGVCGEIPRGPVQSEPLALHNIWYVLRIHSHTHT